MDADWGNGRVEYRGGMVLYFENDGVVWYDAVKGVAKERWQAELAPYEGPGHVGLPIWPEIHFAN
jgi:hypothetical protein